MLAVPGRLIVMRLSAGIIGCAHTAIVSNQEQQPRPLDPPMLPFAIGGMLVWAVAGLVLLLAREWLDRHGHTNWLWICLAGFLLGLPGLAVMLRHDANRRHRRSIS
jgi:Protein of unknown function (DUF2530)